MNNKRLIIFIIALILALVCALFISKKDSEVAEKLLPDEVKEEAVVNNEVEEKFEENSIQNEVLTKIEKVFNQKEENQKVDLSSQEKENVYSEENIVHEVGVIEEVEDFGIRKDSNGLVEITREFKLKSPTKYSFVDFGVLEKVVR